MCVRRSEPSGSSGFGRLPRPQDAPMTSVVTRRPKRFVSAVSIVIHVQLYCFVYTKRRRPEQETKPYATRRPATRTRDRDGDSASPGARPDAGGHDRRTDRGQNVIHVRCSCVALDGRPSPRWRLSTTAARAGRVAARREEDVLARRLAHADGPAEEGGCVSESACSRRIPQLIESSRSGAPRASSAARAFFSA